MESSSLLALRALGQSPWYDNIDRRLIQGGELQRFFDQGITGVTSNPTIFEKAVKGSSVYDQTIQRLAANKASPEEIYDGLTMEDVRSAADMLLPVYKKSLGMDGYVSLEVLPRYAYEAEKTIEHAQRLFKEVDRPNLMIKVPGTVQGAEAIRVLTREGINVNVTLLFSLGHYERSARAYMDGLRERLSRGKPLPEVCSVASVFVSRVDTLVDEILKETDGEALRGKIAVANAKIIYQKFRELFHPDSFGELASKGARIQRLLWGSTSTKNPEYDDLKYVHQLIGKDTINTLPHSTLEAFLDHGAPKTTIVEDDLDKERALIRELEALGIELKGVCDQLQQEGVEAFSSSFDQLIKAITAKMQSVTT
jgi:transaldolase